MNVIRIMALKTSPTLRILVLGLGLLAGGLCEARGGFGGFNGGFQGSGIHPGGGWQGHDFHNYDGYNNYRPGYGYRNYDYGYDNGGAVVINPGVYDDEDDSSFCQSVQTCDPNGNCIETQHCD